jgi:hypothetical protein
MSRSRYVFPERLVTGLGITESVPPDGLFGFLASVATHMETGRLEGSFRPAPVLAVTILPKHDVLLARRAIRIGLSDAQLGAKAYSELPDSKESPTAASFMGSVILGGYLRVEIDQTEIIGPERQAARLTLLSAAGLTPEAIEAESEEGTLADLHRCFVNLGRFSKGSPEDFMELTRAASASMLDGFSFTFDKVRHGTPSQIGRPQ